METMKHCKNCSFYIHDLYKVTYCGRTRGSLLKLCGLHNDWRTDGEFCSSWKAISNQQPAGKATGYSPLQSEPSGTVPDGTEDGER